ncbi:PP2C family protein-serine/threonine phosphatase [Crenobacter cavernae]|uniref:Serine/threonine-protein phosphatase n=1 Tax=Crenobacter cavernae TaxID=2290923 RepID=A0A345Y619_9NEIS|nr:protein phosphatase 2C domain-containing protein [Crenobacter cavernae]AXK39371.1 serine/threonine-protein phosphatase [Crenobacter cavernae]
MKLAFFQDSRTGGRAYNQDRCAFAYSEEAALLVVADGMGGHLQGEVAAQITSDVLIDCFHQQAQPGIAYPNRFLVNAVSAAHQAILDYTIDHHLPEVPSTTVVVALIQQGMLYWCHVGDSRLYLIDQDGVRLRSRDHSQVQRMIDQGLLTEETARVHPDRNKIYNCLGASPEPDIDIGERQALVPGQTVLLCSDGLWGYIHDAEWAKVFTGRTVSQVMPALMNVAERRGGVSGDNLTAIAITLLPDAVELAERADLIDTARAESRHGKAAPCERNVAIAHREILASQLPPALPAS